jgi:hypothetical protein
MICSSICAPPIFFVRLYQGKIIAMRLTGQMNCLKLNRNLFSKEAKIYIRQNIFTLHGQLWRWMEAARELLSAVAAVQIQSSGVGVGIGSPL